MVSSHSPPLSGQRPTVFLRTHLVPERAHMYIHSFRSYDGPRTEAQCPGDCLRSTEKDGEPQRGSVPCPRPSNFSGVAGSILVSLFVKFGGETGYSPIPFPVWDATGTGPFLVTLL